MAAAGGAGSRFVGRRWANPLNPDGESPSRDRLAGAKRTGNDFRLRLGLHLTRCSSPVTRSASGLRRSKIPPRIIVVLIRSRASPEASAAAVFMLSLTKPLRYASRDTF